MLKHIDDFVKALYGGRGDLDSWLECNNEAECRAAILGMVDQRLADCQAALALKNAALQHMLERPPLAKHHSILPEALAIKPDNAALRECGARLLETLANGRDRIGGVGMLPFELRQSANCLRSGEWTPEVLK